jgi:hypothetical protein
MSRPKGCNGFVYIVQEREFVRLTESSVYSVGSTADVVKRFRRYPLGSTFVCCMPCIDVDQAKKRVLDRFKTEGFFLRDDLGCDYYYEGDVLKMQQALTAAVCDVGLNGDERTLIYHLPKKPALRLHPLLYQLPALAKQHGALLVLSQVNATYNLRVIASKSACEKMRTGGASDAITSACDYVLRRLLAPRQRSCLSHIVEVKPGALSVFDISECDIEEYRTVQPGDPHTWQLDSLDHTLCTPSELFKEFRTHHFEIESPALVMSLTGETLYTADNASNFMNKWGLQEGIHHPDRC